MKKALSILTAFILLFELTYAAAPVECKASYVAGSLGIGIDSRGTLQVGDEALIVAEGLLAQVAPALGWDSPPVLARFSGRELVGEGEEWVGASIPVGRP